MGKLAFRIRCIALAGLLAPSSVFAAGLGRLAVLSALGEPLRAEVEIVAVQPHEADSLSARLAPTAAFKQSNTEINSALFDLRFNVERRPNGQHVVVLSSSKPLNEPFLELLLELSWSGGRLVREYTFLLDPPEYRGGSATASATIPATPPTVQPLPAPAARAPEAEARVKPAPDGPARRGDTLAQIARQHMPAGVSLQQMLVALYRTNEDAFMGNNMNRLRAGRILNIPDSETALAIAVPEARKVVSAQTADYAEFQRSIGAAVASTAARPEATRQAAGRISDAARERPTPPADTSKDQLRLSKPDDAKGDGKAGAGKAAAGKAAAATTDDIAARDKALREAQERIALLEKNIADLKKLQEVRSAAGAQAQQQAEAAKGAAKGDAAKGDASKAPAAAAKAPAPVTAPAPVAVAPDAAKPAPPAEGGRAPDVAKAAPEAAKKAEDAAKGGEPGKAADAPKAAEPGKAPGAAVAPDKAAPAKAAPAAPAEPPGLLDELLDNVYLIGALALLVLLLIGYAIYARTRRNKPEEARFSGGALAAPEEPHGVIGGAGGEHVDTASSALTDFSESTAKADADEIDPVAEADVYMAYGRDTQAEEILTEALARDPQRLAVRLKLLEVYANRKDARAFEAAARDMQKITAGQGPDWDKAVALGQQVDPANPLYGAGADKGTEPAPLAAAATGAAAGLAAAAAAAAATSQRTAEPDTAPLDFDLDLGTSAAPAQPDFNLEASSPSDQPMSLDFDLDLVGHKATAQTTDASAETPALDSSDGAAAAKATASDPNVMDFDLGLDAAAATPDATAPEAQPATAESSLAIPPAGDWGSSNAIDFDLNLDEPVPALGEQKPEEKPVDEHFADISSIEPMSMEQAPSDQPAVDKPADETALRIDEAPTIPDFDLTSIDLDLGNGSTEPVQGVDSKWQEVATKLDLAKAYEEMGDKDGARDLLNEVVREGDTTQQPQAKSMLEALV